MVAALWLAAVLAPLAGAVALTLLRRAPEPVRRRAARGAALTLLPALVLTLVPGGAPAQEADWLLLGSSVALDAVGRPLLLVAVLLYGVALRASARDPGTRSVELEAFLLVCFVGNMGVYVAADAVTFYCSFALMSFAAFGLVIHHRDGPARHAGRVYLTLTVLSESAILVGLLLIVSAGGTMLVDAPSAAADSVHTGWIVALLLIGFGVKAALLPLHVWLPLAHPVAPPAASAVLSGAMVKAGLVGWLRFLPLGEVELRGWGTLAVVLALGGAFAAVPIGCLQRDPKVVLAYSTISQMGYLGAIVGVALASPGLAPVAAQAAVVYAVHHGLAKGALFLGVPVWKHHGHGRTRLPVLVGLALAALAVAGAPLSSGSVGKYATKTAVEGATFAGFDLVNLLALVAAGSTVLLLRFGALLIRGDLDPSPTRRDPELPAWLVLVVTSVSVPWVVTEQWVPAEVVPGLEVVTVWDAAWPILLGVAVALVARQLDRSPRVPGWVAHPSERLVPPGDLLVPTEAALRRLGAGTQHAVGAVGRRSAALTGWAHEAGRALVRLSGAAARAEGWLGRWSSSGIVLLLLLAAAAVLPGVLT